MVSETEVIEERLKSFIPQLQSKRGILERIVYKNKTQNRRSSYFKYLLKVRRDLKLLLSAHLEEILDSCFLVINGKKPKQKVHLLESLKKKKCDSGKYNFLEQLLGAARLSSEFSRTCSNRWGWQSDEMSEPILRATISNCSGEILTFGSVTVGFNLGVFPMRSCPLNLSIGFTWPPSNSNTANAVTVFNMVSSLSQRQQSVKITQDGIEVCEDPFLVYLDIFMIR
ncbi:hypothetical protein RJ641_034721 [Dillenia turbinata]|uniref:Uncharacterized protein n=1 Tax=Dillenia turbinata TaxID=194707 RepID=A0AAN8VR57_9MAGN